MDANVRTGDIMSSELKAAGVTPVGCKAMGEALLRAIEG